MDAKGRFALVLLAGTFLCATFAAPSAENIKLPPETAQLKISALPGYRIAMQKCGICHSADYVNLQPPRMTIAQWTAEMVKMQHTYGAPLTDADIPLLGEYLGLTYGGDTPTK